MRFVYMNYVRLHHCDSLDQLMQQRIPFPLPFFGLPLIFFNLPLPFVHRVDMFIHCSEHSHGQQRQALQAADSVLH